MSSTITRSDRGGEGDSLEVRVANMDCESDAAAIERGLAGAPGLLDVQTYPKAGKVVLGFDPHTTDPERLKDRLAELGFPTKEGFAPSAPTKPWRNPKVLAAAAAGVLALAGWLLGFTAAPEIAATGLFWLAIVVGGYFFGREALEDLFFERKIGIELLMSIAAITAALLGEPLEGAILVFLYSLSEAAEGYTEERTRSAVRALMDLAPKTARVERDGREEEIPATEVQVGDVFLIRPGESLPTDGEIVSGRSNLNEAPVTGESVPVEKEPGDTVYAGSINGEGALEVRATKAFADNTISRIIHMVEEAQEKKGRSQRFIERFGRRYSPAVLLAGVLLALIPPLLFGAAWDTWLARATIFIVAAAPCALVISIPITAVAALGTAARQGILIKGGVYLEELGRLRAVAMDKTGTLTRGQPQLVEVRPAGDHTVDDVVALAAAVERRSEHPLARAVVAGAEERGLTADMAEAFEATTGGGAQATVSGTRYLIGSPSFVEGRGLDLDAVHADVEQLQNQGNTVVVLATGQAVLGVLAIADTVRDQSARAVADLHRLGIEQVVMLTGDNPRTAAAIAEQVGIDETGAELSPQDKAARVEALTDRYQHVAMVGDGINDAPPLAAASVGIAMGTAGSDIAIETADIALMADDLDKLTEAVRIGQRTRGVVRQNLVLSFIILAVLVPGAAIGLIGLPLAVLAHELSELVVIVNGTRMARA